MNQKIPHKNTSLPAKLPTQKKKTNSVRNKFSQKRSHIKANLIKTNHKYQSFCPHRISLPQKMENFNYDFARSQLTDESNTWVTNDDLEHLLGPYWCHTRGEMAPFLPPNPVLEKLFKEQIQAERTHKKARQAHSGTASYFGKDNEDLTEYHRVHDPYPHHHKFFQVVYQAHLRLSESSAAVKLLVRPTKDPVNSELAFAIYAGQITSVPQRMYSRPTQPTPNHYIFSSPEHGTIDAHTTLYYVGFLAALPNPIEALRQNPALYKEYPNIGRYINAIHPDDVEKGTGPTQNAAMGVALTSVDGIYLYSNY
jgi:hypothetical protein